MLKEAMQQFSKEAYVARWHLAAMVFVVIPILTVLARYYLPLTK